MARLPVHKLKTNARELSLGSAKVYHLPDWHALSHPQRLVVIRQISLMRGRDPRIATLALKILKKSSARPRQYKKQAAAILKWVQDPKNIYYVNEPGERLADPLWTIKAGFGDCDDQVLVLGALFESIGLPWKLVLSGRNKETGQKVRYIQGDPIPPNTRWAHIYMMVGDRPFHPAKWYFAEPTVEGVPLGWDVISGDERYLPEMAKKSEGPARIVRLKPAPLGYKRSKLPRRERRSPAYSQVYGGFARANNSVSAAVGASVAAEVADEGLNWKKITGAVATGVAVSVGTQILLDWVRGKGLWEGKGSAVVRWGDVNRKLGKTSAFYLPSPFKGK